MKKSVNLLLVFIILTAGSAARPYKGGELRTIESTTYGRFEVRMQSAPGSGVVSSFFTYNDNDPDWPNNWNEIDVEILGRYTDEVQFNAITQGEVHHVQTETVDFNPHQGLHTYAFEWTPIYIAWFIDDVEMYRHTLGYVQDMYHSQKIMMNLWQPMYEDWAGEFNDDILPVYAYYDYVKYYSYTPGSGSYGSDNLFTFEWEDHFDEWDQSRWQKATHTFDNNNVDFVPQNVVFQDGYMILCMTEPGELGFNGEIPFDDEESEFLRAEGPDIVDADGNVVLLQGLGLGGWLVPEGYMLQIPGYGSPTSIREMIIELIGEDAAENFYELYEQNYVNESDIELIANWGFNSIRLPMHYNKLSPEPGVYLEEGFAQVDSLIAWCARNEMHVVLDLHCAPGGQNDGNISDSNGEALLWSVESNQTHTVLLWQEIAQRYSDEVWVAGYDLLNEPVLPEGYDNSHLRDLYEEITEAIRTVDQDHILFIEGNTYATDFNLLTPPWDDNMVYAFHKYWSEVSEESLDGMLYIRNMYDVPLWLGESGENSNHWFASLIELCNENGISWNWWTHKKIATITSPLSADVSPAYQEVLDYWNDNAPQPSAAYAEAALLSMADALAYQNCRFRPDVLAALTSDLFLSENVPYTEHLIPGSIDCVDYDIGGYGVSYSDADYWHTDFNNYQPWNTGYQYRNDGVDIEESSAGSGTDYNVGWTNISEWLEYTVEIEVPGSYIFEITAASDGGGGALTLLVDGVPTGGILNIPDTNGWQNWELLQQENIDLPEGEHIIKLLIVSAGFNLGKMEFILDVPSVPGDLNQDAAVDVLDVVLLVDLILFSEPDEYQLWAGDLIEDGTLDILDIIVLVDLILNG